MAGDSAPRGVSGFLARLRGRRPASGDLRHLEDRERGLARAADQWLTLLRDMESSGESGDPRYDRYFQAYIEAREMQKQADLDLFNVRRGLNR